MTTRTKRENVFLIRLTEAEDALVRKASELTERPKAQFARVALLKEARAVTSEKVDTTS